MIRTCLYAASSRSNADFGSVGSLEEACYLHITEYSSKLIILVGSEVRERSEQVGVTDSWACDLKL